jgi:hypothetical protein
MDDTATRNLASRVRTVLEEFGSVELDRMTHLLGVPGPVLFEAFGWMSRENTIVIEGNRIRLRSHDNGTSATLRP